MLLSKQPTCDYYLIPCYTVYIHKNINLKKLKGSGNSTRWTLNIKFAITWICNHYILQLISNNI